MGNRLAWVCQRIIKSKTDFKIPVEGTTVQNITLPPPFSPAVQPSVQTIQRTKRRLRLASSCQHFANRKVKWGVSKDEEPAFEEPAFHHPKTALTNIDGTDWGKITYKACHHRNAKVGGCQTRPGIHSYCWVVWTFIPPVKRSLDLSSRRSLTVNHPISSLFNIILC